MFGDRILLPDKRRAPAYDSEATGARRGFAFACTCCGGEVALDLRSYVGNYQDLEHVLGPGEAEAIRQHFGLRRDKSLVDGWPRFRVELCGNCATPYLVYVAVHEPANGWVKIVPQGITRLLPGPSPAPTSPPAP